MLECQPSSEGAEPGASKRGREREHEKGSRHTARAHGSGEPAGSGEPGGPGEPLPRQRERGSSAHGTGREEGGPLAARAGRSSSGPKGPDSASRSHPDQIGLSPHGGEVHSTRHAGKGEGRRESGGSANLAGPAGSAGSTAVQLPAPQEASRGPSQAPSHASSRAPSRCAPAGDEGDPSGKDQLTISNKSVGKILRGVPEAPKGQPASDLGSAPQPAVLARRSQMGAGPWPLPAGRAGEETQSGLLCDISAIEKTGVGG